MIRALALSFALLLSGPQEPQSQQAQPVPDAPSPQQNQQVPDAPAPAQPQDNSLDNLRQQVAPGKASNPDTNQPDTTPKAAPAAQQPPAENQPFPEQTEPPITPPPGQAPFDSIRVTVNYVEVPVTIRDKHNQVVPSLQARDFRIFEDGVPQKIVRFTEDAFPLSVAFVIDQSVPRDTMEKINSSLSAFTGALTPQDEVAVFTYSNGPEERTTFTAAQGNRLPEVLARSKSAGRDMGIPVNTGPMATNGPIINNQSPDPNLTRGGASAGGFITIPKEIHTLNDALLMAGKSLATRPKEYRRLIYVISDGKEYGSKASVKQVIQFLNTNKIAVFGTLVGDSATWGLGYLDKVHLPLLPVNNVLPKYTIATGGSLDAEFSANGIQRSYSDLLGAVRRQYTLGYLSHSPAIAGKRHDIDVRLPNRPGLDVQARLFYYTSAADK